MFFTKLHLQSSFNHVLGITLFLLTNPDTRLTVTISRWFGSRKGEVRFAVSEGLAFGNWSWIFLAWRELEFRGSALIGRQWRALPGLGWNISFCGSRMEKIIRIESQMSIRLRQKRERIHHFRHILRRQRICSQQILSIVKQFIHFHRLPLKTVAVRIQLRRLLGQLRLHFKEA